MKDTAVSGVEQKGNETTGVKPPELATNMKYGIILFRFIFTHILVWPFHVVSDTHYSVVYNVEKTDAAP